MNNKENYEFMKSLCDFLKDNDEEIEEEGIERFIDNLDWEHQIPYMEFCKLCGKYYTGYVCRALKILYFVNREIVE